MKKKKTSAGPWPTFHNMIKFLTEWPAESNQHVTLTYFSQFYDQLKIVVYSSSSETDLCVKLNTTSIWSWSTFCNLVTSYVFYTRLQQRLE